MIVADFIIQFLADRGVSHIFMITGGQAMFLNDAVFRNRKIKPIFNHHEQASGMAAEAYSRIKGDLGIAMVTAGPGAMNALNGVVGGYADSAPMMVISGQSALSNVNYMEQTKIRQIGLQGIYTKPIVESVTKYFVTVDDPAKILYYLEKASFIAFDGRPGPVWIEVPLDLQRMEVPKKLLYKFTPPKVKYNKAALDKNISSTLAALYKSKRPLLLVGQGVRLSGAADDFNKLLAKVKIPVVTTRLGIDLIESKNKYFVGRPGLYGDRAANFAVQTADLIISLGARLDTGIVGYEPQVWGRNAKKIVCDIDKHELEKPGINIDLAVFANVRDYLVGLQKRISVTRLSELESWVELCNTWKEKYPMVLPEYRFPRTDALSSLSTNREPRTDALSSLSTNREPRTDALSSLSTNKNGKGINSYYFTERLSQAASSSDNILVDTSSVFHVVSQTWKIKGGQRFITTGGISTMGYWVASIGVCLANGRRTIVISGDGSLQMNIQELATIKQNKLPIKIFVINNNGYLLIRHTQKTHLGGRFMGESPKTGLWCPHPMDIAKAYKIKGIDITSSGDLDRRIKEALAFNGPVICNVPSPEWQLIMPRVASEKKPDGSFFSRPYEDMFPFLSQEELDSNLSLKEQVEA